MENITSLSQAAQTTGRDVVVDGDLYTILQQVVVVTGTFFSFSGIVTNIINIKTFIAVGTEDAIVISLIALSLSDLFYAMFTIVVCMGVLLSHIEVQYDIIFPISPMVILIFFSAIAIPMYAITELTTTFLAVVRCLCVARPLHFKNVITRSRSIYIHTFFALFVAAWYIPILSQTGSRWAYDPSVNTTRVVLWYSDIREDIKDTVFLFFDTIFSFTSKVVMIICIIIMAHTLKKSLKFRQSSKAGSEEKESSNKLSGKELQVVKQVVLISSLYILCSLPKMVHSLYSFIEPQFDVGKREHYFYLSTAYICNVLENFNSASTLIVYYNFNSKYRAKFLKC